MSYPLLLLGSCFSILVIGKLWQRDEYALGPLHFFSWSHHPVSHRHISERISRMRSPIMTRGFLEYLLDIIPISAVLTQCFKPSLTLLGIKPAFRKDQSGGVDSVDEV